MFQTPLKLEIELPDLKVHSSQLNLDPSEDTHEDCQKWNRMEISSMRKGQEFQTTSKYAGFATSASWAVNWILLVVKIYVFAISSSKAVLASLADSAVDLASQALLSLTESYIGKHSPDYPVGRSRLEALSVFACAFIMTMASVEVIQFSVMDILAGVDGNIPPLDISVAAYSILSIVVVLKVILYVYCKWANSDASFKSDTIEALAEDHLNDVGSNIAAIITASIAFNYRSIWWLDPLGAILLSLVIICRWINIMFDQVKKIVGYTAPKEFIDQVEQLAISHDVRLRVDCIRAYHFGARYNVEMEVVLPGNMTVMESHDIALALQHRIEFLDDVERAFVHVDHQLRDGLEHKIERQLVKGVPSPINRNSSSSDMIVNPMGETLRSRTSAKTAAYPASSIGSLSDV